MAKKLAMPDDLYECYLLFMRESEKGILKLIRGKKNRDSFLKSHKPMSRRDFQKYLLGMTLGERSEAEKDLRTPYKQKLEEATRSVEQVLDEYETDPKVRRRADKECQTALAKASRTKK